MRILSSVPNSFLWLLASSDFHESNLKMAAKLAGVNPNALIFASRLPVDEYLARYQFADLFLDTLPFNAGTTASDALYAGTPLLTLAGQSFSGRMSASILNANKIPELITYSEAEYEALAIKLALNPSLLSLIKNKLRENINHSPLFDMASYTRSLESAYKEMYQRHMHNLPPKDLVVSQTKSH
jgi:predicted O-linked N-acetylglucosamine transferase (SPINDLY family)